MHNLELTDIQKNVLLFIKSFGCENGFPPTRQEISAQFNWRSGNSAQQVLDSLERKRAIDVKPGIPRGIKCLV